MINGEYALLMVITMVVNGYLYVFTLRKSNMAGWEPQTNWWFSLDILKVTLWNSTGRNDAIY